MELGEKGHFPSDSAIAIARESVFCEQNLGKPILVRATANAASEIFRYNELQKRVFHEPKSPEKGSRLAKFSMSNSSALSSASSTNSNGLGFQAACYHLYEEGGYAEIAHDNGSYLCFDQAKNELPGCLYTKEDEYTIWDDYWQPDMSDYRNIPMCSTASHDLPESTSSSHRASGGFSWLNNLEDAIDDGIREPGKQEESRKNKRPSAEGSIKALETHCGMASKKQKSSTLFSKDPQTIAAKNRRERISERLRILQDLVPNGSKVDMVTMLEKAISYVKFLQLQVKVLATDDFWPAEDGQAPEQARVKEAFEAIFSSQRHKNLSSV